MPIQQSNPATQIQAALLKVQARMPVIEAAKAVDIPTAKGRMHYTYASLVDIWRQAKPILQEFGVLVSQPTRVTESGHCVLQTILTHVDSGEWVYSEIPLDASNVDARKVGSRLSFMRRYSLCAILALATSDDREAQYEAELQREERRQSGRERTAQVRAGSTSPVAIPPRRNEPPPRDDGPPPQPPTTRQEPPPPVQPDPTPGPPMTEVPTVARLVQLIMAEKKRHIGPDGKADHPEWVIDAIASAVGCDRDRCVSKRHLTTMVAEHPDEAIAFGSRLLESASAAE